LSFEEDIDQIKMLLKNMGLNEYQASTLAHLILLGETKATTLSKTSGVPTARIYNILDQLSKMGLITIRPGRPSLYKPRPPEDIAGTLTMLNMEELRQKLRILEGYTKEFTEISEKIYLKGEKGIPPVPLLRIVSVGEVSIEETKQLYDTAKDEILVLSRAMDYYSNVSENLKKAQSNGVSVRIILQKPDLLGSEDREKQSEVLQKLSEELGAVAEVRFAEEVPMRGCIIDPEREGKALFLVEDPGVPFFLREAAITTHPSVVRGLTLMFDLMWKHRSKP